MTTAEIVLSFTTAMSLLLYVGKCYDYRFLLNGYKVTMKEFQKMEKELNRYKELFKKAIENISKANR